MSTSSCTLAEISYNLAAKLFPSVPSESEQASSLYVSAIDVAQRDYLRFLNRSMNSGHFSATHLISRRSFVVGKDSAEEDSSEWFVDEENAKVAHRLIAESLPAELSSFEELATYISEPERRLRRLLILCGGTCKKAGSKWRFTKIAELVAKESAEGRGRCSEKTIREDLIRAASQREESIRNGEKTSPFAQPKRRVAGPFSGL
jgi:hypothetical protein